MRSVSDEIDKALKQGGRASVRMRLAAWRDFFTERDKDYRWVILAELVVAALLCVAVWFLIYPLLSKELWIGASLLCDAILCGACTVLIMFTLEDLRS